ncbi:DUF2332 domain-containing protein [Sneathiella sp.]|uniref:DUF2332 domain-containing protein n=1 Tax=Sneathiella sp. TaxID=1964365 RepID=UPI00356966AE
MTEKAVRQSFVRQADACEVLGSPFTARLCRLAGNRLRADGAVSRHILSWPGDASAQGDSVPLRLAGALHALVLQQRNSQLAALYPPKNDDVSDADLWAAVVETLGSEEAFILDRLKGPPQTNEVRRAGATLPMFLEVNRRTGLPLVLSEVGASAGLNLFLDQYHVQLGAQSWGDAGSPVRLAPKWRGKAVASVALDIQSRAGCDLRPADPGLEADRERLISFLWPDQVERIARTRAALQIAAKSDIRVVKADALDWLEQRTATAQAGVAHVIYSTIAWQYLPEAARARGEEIIAAAGARASDTAPLAWARMEVDGNSPGAGLTLTLWPGGEQHLVGRADFHGRWVDWFGWPS